MILNLKLSIVSDNGPALLPFNYHYALSSAIYRIIQKSEPDYSTLLHDQWQLGPGLKFTFSDLNITFTGKGDRMLLLQKEAYLTICLHAPPTAYHFLKGLFMDQKLELGDDISSVLFNVISIENYVPILPAAINDITTVIFRPCSPLVVGSKAWGTSKYLYLSPYELPYIDCILWSWLEKYKTVTNMSDFDFMVITRKIRIEVILFDDPPFERMVTIKKGAKGEQKLRGYTKFNLKVSAPPAMIELALNSGLGYKNSLGMGCVKLI